MDFRPGSTSKLVVPGLRGIHCTIPEKRDEIANRKKRGSHGGRPPKFDKADYKERHAGGMRNLWPQVPPRGRHEIRL